MELNQKIVDFFSASLHKTRAEYYLNLFSSMSELGFKNRVKEYCCIARESQKKYFLGHLDNDSLVLLITMQIIQSSIRNKERNRYSVSTVEQPDVYESITNQIQKAMTDYWKVREKLEENIKKVFKKELSLLLESEDLLKRPANFKYQNPGYNFTYDGEAIYIINWYSMGGD